MRARSAIILGVAAVIWSWCQSADPPAPVPSPPTTPYGTPPSVGRQLASVSCASAACHGNGKPGRVGGEYSTWAPDLSDDRPRDPHSHSYRTLTSDTSVRIAKALGLRAAHKDALCLKCHSVEPAEPASTVNEGVGCGSCHGPAERWVSEHYSRGWKATSNRDKWEKNGFVPTKNLTARTLTCVGCHVGDETREVNHQMIAAGHPRLAFEAARFHVLPTYTKHWTERTSQPEFEVRAWVVGQAATLRASANLLRVRAERAANKEPRATWPEFSGSSCYSCHQPIREPSRDAGLGPTAVGTPGWERWSVSAVGVAAAFTPAVFPGCQTPHLNAVRELERVMTDPDPKPGAVRTVAADAVAELDGWLAALQAADDRGSGRMAPGVPADLIRALAADALTPDRRQLRDSDWDFLAAHALGCAAAVHASGGPDAVPALGPSVRKLNELLRFPPQIGGRSARSPAGFGVEQRGQVAELFRTLSAPAPRSGGK